MLKLVVLVALVAAANGASCPAVCSTCFAGGAGGGISLVGGVCHASCSASGYCGTSDAYTNGGTDCTGCAETPTASQRANLKLADAHFVTNTKASITAAELLYKQTVVEFSALFNAGSLLTKSAKMRYNYLLDLDSRKPAAEQALLCVDNCSPTGTWVPPANDPTGCPAGGIYAGMNYCTWASGVGSGSNPYSLCGQTHMDGGGGKCQKTCGTCADKTPYAASELSSLLGRRSNDQCSDGVQNGDETGVDCGGSCSVCPVDCVSSETTCTCTPACGNTCDCTDTITITTPAAGRGQACPSATVRTFAGAACPPGGVERGPTYSAAASANYCVGSTGGPGSGCCIDLSCTILDQTADGYLNTGPLTETPLHFLSPYSGGSSPIWAQLPHPGLKHLDMPNVVNVGGHVVGGGSGDYVEHVSMPVAKKLAHGAFYSIGGGENSGSPAKSCGQATCTGLKVYMPEVEEIWSSCFSGSSLSGIVNMPSVLEIKGYAFSQCSAITGVIMPKVRTIGYQAFTYGPWLTDVTLPKDCRQGPARWTSPPVTSNFIPGQVFPNGNSDYCGINSYLGKSPCRDGKWPDTTITREGCSGGAATC